MCDVPRGLTQKIPFPLLYVMLMLSSVTWKECIICSPAVSELVEKR